MEKVEIISFIRKHLEKQLSDYIAELNSTNEEIGKETKSSAGDKFETSREMMNQEVSRIEERIAYLKRQLNSLNQISTNSVDTITNGSLVWTNHGLFFFGIAFGKLDIESNVLLGLSLNSPLGQLMKDKKTGEELNFMNRNYKIKSVQ